MRAKIGFDVPFEPFGLLEQGKPAGLLIDLVAALFDHAGVPYEFVSMTLAETENALLGGRVDALAYKGITPERLKTMIFSAPLLISGGAIFTRAGAPNTGQPVALDGKTVVTPRKGPLWTNIETKHPTIRLLDGDSYEGSFAALLDGRADAAALNLHAGIAIAKRLHPGRLELPTTPYAELPIAFAIATNGPRPLVEAIDAALPEIRANGTFQRLHDRWLGA